MNEIIANNGINNPFRIFDYKNLGSVRTFVDEKGYVWFCLIDVCRILEINHVATVANRLNRDGVVTTHSVDSLGRNQELTFINEANLYETIFKSRKPEAEDLKKWVFNEVLPSIRKTGSYVHNKEGLISVAMETIAEGFRRQEEINRNQAEINQYQTEINLKQERRASNLTGRVIELEDRLYDERMINRHIINEQMQVIRNSYVTILGYMRINAVPNDSIDTLRMGRLASKMCRERRIETVKIKDNRFDYVNGYPYELLDELFENELYAQ